MKRKQQQRMKGRRSKFSFLTTISRSMCARMDSLASIDLSLVGPHIASCCTLLSVFVSVFDSPKYLFSFSCSPLYQISSCVRCCSQLSVLNGPSKNGRCFPLIFFLIFSLNFMFTEVKITEHGRMCTFGKVCFYNIISHHSCDDFRSFVHVPFSKFNRSSVFYLCCIAFLCVRWQTRIGFKFNALIDRNFFSFNSTESLHDHYHTFNTKVNT